MLPQHELIARTRLEKVSSETVIAWLLVATALLALAGMIVVTNDFDFGVASAVIMLPFLLVSIVTAWKLDEAPGPIIALHDDGLDLSPAFGSGARIPWASIERFRIVHWRFNYIFRVPFMTYLCIELHDGDYLAPHLRLAPMGWFNRLYIPTRLIKGGTFAAKRVMVAAQDGALIGGVDRAAVADGVPRLMANGDAAIARAIAARGGFGNLQAQPRKPDDRAAGSDAPEPIPDATPDMIIVNGKPYRPQRPAAGGFGRKRA